jgi:hypothetical protein
MAKEPRPISSATEYAPTCLSSMVTGRCYPFDVVGGWFVEVAAHGPSRSENLVLWRNGDEVVVAERKLKFIVI